MVARAQPKPTPRRLGAEEEHALALRIAAGDLAARAELAEANLRLVAFFARRYRGRGLDLPDLINEGKVGLMRAIDKFDPHRTVDGKRVRFSTYAKWWIRDAIQRGIQRTGRIVHVPMAHQELAARARRSRRRLEAQLGREPTLTEIAEHMGLGPRPERVAEVLDSTGTHAYELNPTGSASTEHRDAFQQLLDAQRRDRIHAKLGLLVDALDDLDPRESALLKLLFGIDGEPQLSMDEAARRLRLDDWEARWAYGSAIQKLRARLAATTGPSAPFRDNR